MERGNPVPSPGAIMGDVLKWGSSPLLTYLNENRIKRLYVSTTSNRISRCMVPCHEPRKGCCPFVRNARRLEMLTITGTRSRSMSKPGLRRPSHIAFVQIATRKHLKKSNNPVEQTA
jgi:hypothetical protein